MKKIALVVLAVLAIVMISGCATTFTTTNGKLAYGDVKGTEVGEVSAEARMVYLIHPSLLSFKAPNEELDTIVEPAMAEVGATAVKDVTITMENDIMAFLASYIGFGYPLVKVDGVGVK